MTTQDEHNVHDQMADEEFELFLCKHLRNSTAYITDDGFTAITLKALPSPPRSLRSRFWPKLFASAIGLGLATPLLLMAGTTVIDWANGLTTVSLLQSGVVTSGIIFGSAMVWFCRELDVI